MLRVCALFANSRLFVNTKKSAISSVLKSKMNHQGCLRKNTVTVAVEGNIGSGKTELINMFSSCSDVEAFSEPVNKWTDVEGFNVLDQMYKDPKRWCFAFQTYVQMTMVTNHLAETTAQVKLMERSVFSSRFCFAENLYRSGVMEEMDYVILKGWFDFLIEKHSCPLDLIVYLRTEPEVAHERLKARGRKEEKTVPLEYLQALHELHESWLLGRSKFSLPAPVLVIDANSNLSHMREVYEERRQEILCGVA